MNRFQWALLLAGILTATPSVSSAPVRPNIVYILADDLGYGDVQCLNPHGRIPTPHLDRLASEGMIFTDAHSSSAVCTPTRYGILTGRYNWRSRLKSGVLGGFSRRLIEPGRLTVPAFLSREGYATACIGKWHLGLAWQLRDGGTADDQGNFSRLYEHAWDVDYAQAVREGPLSLGFDYFFGISASLDMPPYVFIENDRATELPTTTKTFLRAGPAGEAFEGVEVLPKLADRAAGFIAVQASAAKAGRPFFLYLPLTSPHTPILPGPGWEGRSGIGSYADFVMQTDGAVGRVLEALNRNGLADDTLVIFTSDNGCSPAANFDALARHGHHPSYVFRGAKADIFEGGHRVPFIVRWPGHVAPGETSPQLACLTDLFATVADILGKRLPADAAEDSVSLLPALEGRARGSLRDAVVHHSINGSFAIRQGRWKLVLTADSGGWSDPRPGSEAARGLPDVQLYDLVADVGETRNLQAEHPEQVARLSRLLEEYVARGRSTPGRKQSNTGEIRLRP